MAAASKAVRGLFAQQPWLCNGRPARGD